MSFHHASNLVTSTRNGRRRRVSSVSTFILFVAAAVGAGSSLRVVDAAHMRASAASSSAGSYSNDNTLARGVYSIWEANDTCSEPESSKNCLIDVTCSGCLLRPGCAIESSTGKCVSVSRISATTYSSVEYFQSGRTEYCDAKDDACTACSAPDAASNAVCRGRDGCVCLRQCEAAPVKVIQCSGDSTSTFSLFYAVIALAFLAPAIIMARVYKSLTHNLSTDISRVMQREQRHAAHDSNPMTMKLDGWREYMQKEIQEHPDTLDHTLCPVRSSEMDTESIEEGRKTDDCDSLRITHGSERCSSIAASLASLCDDGSDDDTEYVPVATPKGSAAPSNV